MNLREQEMDRLHRFPNERSQYCVDFVVAITLLDPHHLVQVSNQIAQKWRARGNMLHQITTQQRIRSQLNPMNSSY